MSGWPVELFCFTCGDRPRETCHDSHRVELVHLLDAITPHRDREERIARARENEARMLGERDAA